MKAFSVFFCMGYFSIGQLGLGLSGLDWVGCIWRTIFRAELSSRSLPIYIHFVLINFTSRG